MPLNSPCLRYPRFDSFVQIHDWQLELCGKDKTAAALLSVFEHKHQAIAENRETVSEIRNLAIAAGYNLPADAKFWFCFTDEQLIHRVKIGKKEAIYKGLAILEEKGFIETTPPDELKFLLKTGRTKWFRFRPDRIQPLIDAYDQTKWGARAASMVIPELRGRAGAPSCSVKADACLIAWRKRAASSWPFRPRPKTRPPSC